jgi:hypothetical protein
MECRPRPRRRNASARPSGESANCGVVIESRRRREHRPDRRDDGERTGAGGLGRSISAQAASAVRTAPATAAATIPPCAGVGARGRNRCLPHASAARARRRSPAT